MSSTTIRHRRPVRRRIPALVAAGALAAGAGLVMPGVANGATMSFPANQTFDTGTGPWTSSASCSLLDGLVTPSGPAPQDLLEDLAALFPGNAGINGLLNQILGGTGVTLDEVGALLSDLGITCSIDSGITTGDGNPPGSLRTAIKGLTPDVANALELLGRGLAHWTSEDFLYDAAAPTKVEFSFDGKAGLTGLLEQGKGFIVRARLETVNTGQVRDIGQWTFTKADGAFRTRTVELPASSLSPGNFYRISLEIETTGDLQLLSTVHELLLDNVRLTATAPGGNDGTGGSGGSGPGGEGANLRPGEGAGGLGACTPNIQQPREPGPRQAPGTIQLTREQLVINQRISSAAVKRVNSAMDRLMGGLTSDDFQDCTLGPDKFTPAFLQAIAGGAPAGPATPAGAERATPDRAAGPDKSGQIALTREQLLINQRISSAAVRRVNAIAERLKGGLTAGDFRLGGLRAPTLNSAGRARFANALPAVQEATAAFVPFNTAPKGSGNPQDVEVSREQLVINQRISSAAVRRINAIQAQFDVGLTGENVKPGSLLRNNLAPAIQLGQK